MLEDRYRSVIPIRQMRRKLAIFVASISFISCSSAPRIDGSWVLWSVDGLPVAEAPPERTDLPAGNYLGLVVSAGDAAREYSIDSMTIQFQPDGEYLETRFETTTLVLSAAVYRQMTGLPTSGTAPVRHPEGSEVAVWRAWRCFTQSSSGPTQKCGLYATSQRWPSTSLK